MALVLHNLLILIPLLWGVSGTGWTTHIAGFTHSHNEVLLYGLEWTAGAEQQSVHSNIGMLPGALVVVSVSSLLPTFRKGSCISTSQQLGLPESFNEFFLHKLFTT